MPGLIAISASGPLGRASAITASSASPRFGYAPFIPLEEGFLSYPTGYMRGDEVPLTRRAPSPPPDPDSFDGMRVRTGIPRPPTPEPTLYRLVGPRDRPATLVTRIAGEGAGRHRHAESGALLLIVPRR